MYQQTNKRNIQNASSKQSTQMDSALSRSYTTQMTATKIAQMQKTIGNRAVTQLLKSQLQSTNPSSNPASSRHPVAQRIKASKEITSVASDQPTHSQSLVQRRVLPHDTHFNFDDEQVKATYKTKVEAIVNDVNERVLQARATALQWQAFKDSPFAHLSQWYDSASAYATNPESIPKLVHARFGYAIETLACNGLGDQQGLRVNLQVAHGHTRPDIVISEGTNEVAWIDITSEQSAGHIKGKDGSGWKSKPFIYEVLYDPLQLKEILEGTNDPLDNEYGEFLSGEHRIEADEKEKKKTEFRNKFIDFQDQNDWSTGTGNAQDKKEMTKNFFFGESFENEESYRNKMQMTKGALNYLGINDGPFGFNVGNVKQKSAAIKALIDDHTKEEIRLKKGQFAHDKNIELAQALEGYKEKSPAVSAYNKAVEMNSVNREVAKTGMALKHAIQDYQGLEQFIAQADVEFDLNDARVKELIAHTTTIMTQFPQEAELARIQTWRGHVKELHKYRSLLHRITMAQKQFIEYVKVKYPNPFPVPQVVKQIWEEFDKKPQNDLVIKIAEQWIIENPIPIAVPLANVHHENNGNQAMEESD